MAEAEFRHGTPDMVEYTPAANIAAGQVVLLGNTAGLTCGIAHVPLTNAVLGTIAKGGGIYDVTNLNNAANDAKVWWDDSVNKLSLIHI